VAVTKVVSQTPLAKTEEEDKWEKFEKGQGANEWQREWREFLMEMGQDHYEMIQRKSISYLSKRDFRLQKQPMLRLLPSCFSVGGPVPTSSSAGEQMEEVLLCRNKEHADYFNHVLDFGQFIFVQFGSDSALANKLTYRVVGAPMAQNLLDTYYTACPPGKTTQQVHADTVAQQEETEQRRHTAMDALLQTEAKSCHFYALFYRSLKRPDDYTRSPVTGSAMLWGCKGDAQAQEDSTLLAKELMGWFKPALVNPDFILQRTVAPELPTYAELYHATFRLGFMPAIKEKPLAVEAVPALLEQSETIGHVPEKVSPLSFCDGLGEALPDARAVADIGGALERGNFVYCVMDKARRFHYHTHGDQSSTLVEAWESWKLPFQELSRLTDAASSAQGFRRAMPAWMHGEQQRYQNFIRHLQSQFPAQSLIGVYRMMKEPPDVLKPAAFSDIVLHWLPPSDAARHYVTKHGTRLQEWMDNARISNEGLSRVLKIGGANELLDYEAAYQKCFFVKPVLFAKEEVNLHRRNVSVAAARDKLASMGGLTGGLAGGQLDAVGEIKGIVAAGARQLAKKSAAANGKSSATRSTPQSKSKSKSKSKETRDKFGTLRGTLKSIAFKGGEERVWAESCLDKAFTVVKNVDTALRPSGPECLQVCIDIALRMVPAERKQRFLDLVEARCLHEKIEANLVWMMGDDDDSDADSDDSEDELDDVNVGHTLTRRQAKQLFKRVGGDSPSSRRIFDDSPSSKTPSSKRLNKKSPSVSRRTETSSPSIKSPSFIKSPSYKLSSPSPSPSIQEG
jgi:hypothetical protein